MKFIDALSDAARPLLVKKPKIRVVAGDFQAGRATVEVDGLKLKNRGSAPELIVFGQIRHITTLKRERRPTTLNRASGVAAGSILGAVAAGAMAGGLTGPAGAALGAVAGGILAVGRKVGTFRVELTDGRVFIAVAETTTQTAIEAMTKLSRGKSVATRVLTSRPKLLR